MKKHDYDKILYRLTNIWQRLREGEILSVKELAIEYNVSTKTIQRDFNERLITKLPIEKIGHKWKVKDGYSLDKTLSFEEDLVLDILKEFSSTMGELFSTKTNNLFSKLQSSHKNPFYSKIEIEDISLETDTIKNLRQSIEEKKQIEFYFKDKYRFIEPYAITNFDGFWYLYGNDLLENRLKTFYIKNIKSLTQTNNSFKEDTKALEKLKLALNIWFEPSAKTFEVKLLAKSNIAKYFRRRPLNYSQKITRTFEDKSIEITIDVSSKKEVLYEIKKWQPNLLILEPQFLIKEALQDNKEFLSNQLEVIL